TSFCVSVTVTFSGCPTVADPGPASRRTAVFEKASKAYRVSSPWFSFTWQPPTFENLPFTISPQNCVEVCGSSATRDTKKSVPNQSASKVTLFSRAASSSAAVGVDTRDGYAPLFVPSQGWVPPDAGVTSCPSLVTGTSRMVLLAPSPRTIEPTGAANAAGAPARQNRASAPASAVLRRRSDIEPPLPRGSSGCRPESGLLPSSSAPRLPGQPSALQWLHATHQRPFTVAGPRGIHTRLPSTTGR